MTFIGLYSVLVQGLGVRLLTKHFKDNAIILTSMGLMLLGLVGWSLTVNLPALLLVILPLSGGAWIVNTLVTGAITKAVNPEEIGGMLGFSNALESISRIIAPGVGGFILGSVGAWSPGVVGAFATVMAIWLLYSQFARIRKPAPVELPEVECADA
jgi:predicted MFS family arabinose efflux permease